MMPQYIITIVYLVWLFAVLVFLYLIWRRGAIQMERLRNAVIDASIKNADSTQKAVEAALKAADAAAILAKHMEKPRDGQ